MLSRLSSWWKLSLQRRPVLTNTAVYATFYTAAELSQQTFNRIYTAEKPPYDVTSAARVVTVGSCLYAPTLYYCLKGVAAGRHWVHEVTNLVLRSGNAFVTDLEQDTSSELVLLNDEIFRYKFLDKKFVGKSVKVVATKVVSDQLISSPILLAMFYILLGILERKQDPYEELREKYWKTFIANQAFWVPAQTINFFFITPNLRVVYVASVSFIWINVLCFIKRQKLPGKEEN